jgi:hypothetical protein
MLSDLMFFRIACGTWAVLCGRCKGQAWLTLPNERGEALARQRSQ